MDMSNIMDGVQAGEIFAKYINTERINERLRERIEALASQLNPEAGAQLIEDGDKVQVSVTGHGDAINAKTELKESYLISYLENHGVPKSGGDNGIAHNVDGTTYVSNVPMQLQGEELYSLMLPIMDVIEEANNLSRITLHDEVDAAKPSAMTEVKEKIMPNLKTYVIQETRNKLGGGSL